KNGVSTCMHSDKQVSYDHSASDPTPTDRKAAGGPSTQHADAAHKSEAESSSLFVISLTSITNELSHQWLQHFPKQGSYDN
ncbi:hypothetical protein BUZ61_13760, partial [Staphylococcus nepalensis]